MLPACHGIRRRRVSTGKGRQRDGELARQIDSTKAQCPASGTRPCDDDQWRHDVKRDTEHARFEIDVRFIIKNLKKLLGPGDAIAKDTPCL